MRARLLDLLMRESPYPEELIDRLMADTIRKIRERSNRERRKILTRQIKEAERVKDEGLESLVAEKNQTSSGREGAVLKLRIFYYQKRQALKGGWRIFERNTGRNRYGKRNRIG